MGFQPMECNLVVGQGRKKQQPEFVRQISFELGR
jgi:hypothetical protein